MADQTQYTDKEIIAAYAEAFCHLLALPIAQLQGMGGLLIQKKIATPNDLDNATSGIPQAAFERIVNDLRQQMQQRVSEILQQTSAEGRLH